MLSYKVVIGDQNNSFKVLLENICIWIPCQLLWFLAKTFTLKQLAKLAKINVYKKEKKEEKRFQLPSLSSLLFVLLLFVVVASLGWNGNGQEAYAFCKPISGKIRQRQHQCSNEYTWAALGSGSEEEGRNDRIGFVPNP